MDSNKKVNGGQREPQFSLIEELREMRTDAKRLNSSLAKRLKPFRKKDGSFKTLPTSPDLPDNPDEPGTPDISVASTCTVLMAALGAGEHHKLFDEPSASEIFRRSAVCAKWGSSGLPDGNAFTTAMLVRAAGFVVRANLMPTHEVQAPRHVRFDDNEGVALKTLKEIVESKAENPEKSFAVEGYPPKTTHAYWFVDGAIGMEVDLTKHWEKVASWASNEFHQQLIYVSAGNDGLMDPPSLAMAACLINRIRRLIVKKPKLTEVAARLPLKAELEFAIEQVFSQQSNSGIWHKYFPLFHFPRGQGAADYCFSFEFLEAIFAEFGTFVLRNAALLKRVKKILQWCDKYELMFTDSTGTYRGWNAGGEVRKLAAGKSEAWATATVHMFLTQLDRRISDLLDELVLGRFGLDRTAVVESQQKFMELIDIPITFPAESPTTLKQVIEDEILKRAKAFDPEKLVPNEILAPRSALLFGPPGTSKTRLANAIAEYLGWPLIVLNPSDFLGKGLEQVHAQVAERFRDLMDVKQAVVFFDEMDALAQTREGDEPDENSKGVVGTAFRVLQHPSRSGRGETLDVTRQLLTTSMLPKLADLWNQKQVIFLMATNHKQQLDPAIMRPNRFDLLLCVAPPPWTSKCCAANLASILSIPGSEEVEKELLRLAPLGSKAEKVLDLFTVAEVGIFLHHLQRQKNQPTVRDALKQFGEPSEFNRVVDNWAATGITLRVGSRVLSEFQKDRTESRRQY